MLVVATVTLLSLAAVRLPCWPVRSRDIAWLLPQRVEGSLGSSSADYAGSTYEGIRYLAARGAPAEGERSSRSQVALFAAKVSEVNSSINETGDGKNFLALDIGGATVNSTWARTKDRDAVTSHFQITSSGGAACRYSRYTSFGNGWDIVHNRFEVWKKDQPTKTLVYTVESPAALPTNNRAIPKEQCSWIFDRDPALKKAGVDSKELIKIIGDKVGGQKGVQHWEDFTENWKTYS